MEKPIQKLSTYSEREIAVISFLEAFHLQLLTLLNSYPFDLVIHSVTKMLNGHSDLLGGAVAGRTEMINKICPQWTHLFQSLESAKVSNTVELDIALTFRPWESTDNLNDYKIHIL